MARLEKEVLIFITIFLSSTLAVMWLLNGGAYAKELRYRFFLASPIADRDLSDGRILEVRGGSSIVEDTFLKDQSFTVVVPKISTVSPVVIPRNDTLSAILASLEEGVALFPGSALPGRAGRTVLLGHSSRADWYRGGYESIFSLIGKLSTGDEILITSGNQIYKYRVFNSEILTPRETNIFLSEQPKEKELILITCYPLGSSAKRTVVQAKLVSS